MWVRVNYSKSHSSIDLRGRYYRLSHKGRFGEDVYSSLNHHRYIYKIQEDVYAIGRRLGSIAICSFSRSADIYEKGGWYVHTDSGEWIMNNSFAIEEDYDTDDSSIGNCPNAVVVYSRYRNIQGGYRRTGDVLYDCPVYFNEEDATYLYRCSSCWGISPKAGSNHLYMRSRDTGHISPDLADWRNVGITVIPYCTPDPRRECDETSMFCDSNFDANSTSIGDDTHGEVTWIRASNLQPRGTEMVLFHGVEPNDILQGGLGDCWLLCAISSLAEFPNYFKKQIFRTEETSPIGKYEIQLYNAGIRGWTTVTIDDRIPCAKNKWYDIPRPLFAQPHENEMYIMLLEKAIAKAAGSYSKLSGGYPVLAWMALTGCEDLQLWCKDRKNTWKKRVPAIRRDDPWNFQKMWVKRTNKTNNADTMFSYLEHCDSNNFVMGAAIHGDVMEKTRSDGLVERHAYSLIKVYRGDNIKLIQLRNPWGNSHESNLDWCDSSNKWKDHPDIAAEVNWTNAPDGLFWMSWDDFIRVFDEIQIAAMAIP